MVLTNGCFDILHAGHVRYLSEAKAQGDVLIVGLNSDASVRALKGPSRPVNPAADRAEVLAGLRSVDHVVVFAEATAEELVRELQPDIYVKGGDYSLDRLPEAAVAAAYGGRTVLVSLVPGKSTTQCDRGVCRCGKGRAEFMHSWLEKIAASRVLVVGDAMLDRYYFADVTRISPEGPVPVALGEIDQKQAGRRGQRGAQPGAALGCRVAVAGVCGDDDNRRVSDRQAGCAGDQPYLSDPDRTPPPPPRCG